MSSTGCVPRRYDTPPRLRLAFSFLYFLRPTASWTLLFSRRSRDPLPASAPSFPPAIDQPPHSPQPPSSLSLTVCLCFFFLEPEEMGKMGRVFAAVFFFQCFRLFTSILLFQVDRQIGSPTVCLPFHSGSSPLVSRCCCLSSVVARSARVGVIVVVVFLSRAHSPTHLS